MSIYKKLAMATTGVALSCVAINTPAQAAAFLEIGDAGGTFNSAQVVSGLGGQSLDWIQGRLDSTTDNDYFRFFLSESGALKIETGPYFNTPFPANTFPAFQLFDGNNSLIGGYFMGSITDQIGNSAIGNMAIPTAIYYLVGMAEFNFINLSQGEYVLKVDGTGQINQQKPVYQGNYSVRLSGAEIIEDQPCPEPSKLPDESVPEPSTFVAMVVAGGMTWLMKKKYA